MVGADDLAAEGGEGVLEGGGEARAVGLLVVDEVDLLDLRVVEEVLRREGALDLVRGGGAEVGLEGALLVAGLPVLALGEFGAGVGGETWVRLASLRGFCIDWETPEFRGPTTPRTASSSMNFWAFCWPTEGCAWSSSGLTSNLMPGTVFSLLAVLAARSAEFLMPRPRAERSPVMGASTPMTTVWVPPLSLLFLLSSRDPQAVRVSAPVVSTVVSMSKERCRTKGPFPGAASSA